MNDIIESSLKKLIIYVESNNWSGYDIYDIFNSKILSRLNIKNKWCQIALTQFGKKSPLNLRKLLKVEQGHNPKGLGLFLSAYNNLYRIYGNNDIKNKIDQIVNLLKHYSKINTYHGHCWGYNWDYRTRAVFFPKFTPHIVATAFIADAFLNLYETFEKEEYLSIARSSCDFILNDLNRTYENDTFCWSYSPIDHTRIYNSTMLGSKILTRVYSFTKEIELLKESEESIKFVINRQKDDGSWFYGDLPFQNWVDSFHTGYNIECLYDFMKFSGIKTYQNHLEKGLKFYLDNFFLDDGTPKYYHNSVYPIDIHCPAQSFILLSKLKDYDSRTTQILEKVFQWTMNNMWDKNYFYYQKHKFYTNKIPYMRWSQAWMLYALTTLLQSSL